MILAMYKVLLITVLLCIAELGFAKKKIHLRAKARSPIPPVEVCIDGKILEFEILESMRTLDVLIRDVSGDVVFNSMINGGKGVIPLTLDLRNGDYILIIADGEHIFWGDFCIE